MPVAPAPSRRGPSASPSAPSVMGPSFAEGRSADSKRSSGKLVVCTGCWVWFWQKFERVLRASAELARSYAVEIRVVGGRRREELTAREVVLEGPWLLLAFILLQEKPGLRFDREASCPFLSPAAHFIQYTIGKRHIFSLACITTPFCGPQLLTSHPSNPHVPWLFHYSQSAPVTLLQVLLLLETAAF